MTVFDTIKSKNIDDLVEWLSENYETDSSPWTKWWDENYCKKCETEERTVYSPYLGKEINLEYAWCELNDERCRFFPDMDWMPDDKEVIKMWLMSEAGDDD